MFLSFYYFHDFISSKSELNCKQELEKKKIGSIGVESLKKKVFFLVKLQRGKNFLLTETANSVGLSLPTESQ